MKPRLPGFFIVIFTIIQFVPGHCEDDLQISRTIEPVVLQRLESQFLKLFGMEMKPVKRKSSIKIPRYLVELYKSQTGLDLPTSNLHLPGRHTKTANTVRTFYPTSSKLLFDLSSIPPGEEVTGAEIRLPINRTQLLHDHRQGPGKSEDNELKVRVIINDVVKFKGKEPIMYPVDSKLIHVTRRQSEVFSITLDIFPAVSRWIASTHKMNRGLLVQIFDSSNENQILEWSWNPTKNKNSPTLFTYSDDGFHKGRTRDAETLSRQYRSAIEDRRNRKKHRSKNRIKNPCTRREMFVDFADVGWNDWIVAPPGYRAYICSGECSVPMAEHLNATNHAVIQALVNSINPQQVPPPCCVPTKYSGLSLLYNDASDKVVLKNYEDMIVESCGCS